MTNGEAYEIAETLFVRPERDAELVSFLTEVARRHDIVAGSFTAIGALKSARLSFYNQDSRTFTQLHDLQEPQELISCMGAMTVRDGKHHAHAHVVLVDSKGVTRAGHLEEAKVFFTQACIHKLKKVL